MDLLLFSRTIFPPTVRSLVFPSKELQLLLSVLKCKIHHCFFFLSSFGVYLFDLSVNMKSKVTWAIVLSSHFEQVNSSM